MRDARTCSNWQEGAQCNKQAAAAQPQGAGGQAADPWAAYYAAQAAQQQPQQGYQYQAPPQ